MSEKRKGQPPPGLAWTRDHLEQLLDQALADSFPASDPVAIDFEAPVCDHARNTEAGGLPSVIRPRSPSRCRSW
jgi:hypothetical protein